MSSTENVAKGPGEIPRAGLLGDVYSTSWHLLVTAKELGKLDQLLQEIPKEETTDMRIVAMRALGAVLRDGSADGQKKGTAGYGDAIDKLNRLLDITSKNTPAWGDRNAPPFPLHSFLVAVEAARHKNFRKLADELLLNLLQYTRRDNQTDQERGHVRLAMLELSRLRGSKDGTDHSAKPTSVSSELAQLRPKLWIESGVQSAAQHASGSLPGLWIAQDGYVQHVTGAQDSHLIFPYPLAGQFKLTLEGREGDWSEGMSGFGGVVFAVDAFSRRAGLYGIGRKEYRDSPDLQQLLFINPWNRPTIQVDHHKIRFLVNGQLIHVDELGESAPWLMLAADWGRNPIFRNMLLTGDPTILHKVPLLGSGPLRGWVATHFGETLPDPFGRTKRYYDRSTGQWIDPEAFAGGINTPHEGLLVVETRAGQTHWTTQDGELKSARRETKWSEPAESWLYYFRPLREAETVRYEFFYQAGSVEAHPTVGGMAFLLRPDGITRYPITDGRYEVRGITASANTFTPKQLPLRENDWNDVVVAMSANKVVIKLNGEQIFEHPLVPDASQVFGLYHNAATTELRVRKAILQGEDWPREFTAELRKAIESPQPIRPLTDSRFVTATMNEERFSDNAYQIYRQALTMEAAARYQFLHRWVMPNGSHELLRMAGAFTPTHPAPPVIADNPIDLAVAEARGAIDQRMVQTGGNFVCPAILLILAALETDRLDDLEDEVFQIAVTGPAQARARAAMLGIISLMRDRPREADAMLWECQRLVLEPATPPQSIRWPEVAFCSLAIQHPDLRSTAYELLDRIQRGQLQMGNTGESEFSRFVRQLHGQVHYLMYGGEPSQFGTSPALKQWHTVAQPNAKSRGHGYSIGAFDAIAGELALRGGHDVDMCHFQSPLRGDYEVRCRISNFEFRETILMASGVASCLKSTLTEARVTHARAPILDVPLTKKFTPTPRNWHDYRVVIKKGHYTSYVNGQQIYDADLPESTDPWLAVLGRAGHSSRAVRNIVISGQPEIPNELDLLAPPDMKGWMTDYYGADTGKSPYAWRCEKKTLACDQLVLDRSIPGRLKLENIIRYHRPLMENGEISYEFFYDPETKVQLPRNPRVNQEPFVLSRPFVKGQAIVHPALDRLVCLLEPEGVAIHWLTDGRYDRTGMLSGNRTPIINDNIAKKPPLKSNEWNRVQLAIRGDTLTISLNGELVFTHTIEPTNLRHFGLFHFVNESSALVRNVRYRGDWPKTLPSLETQELAAGPEKLAAIPESELPDSFEFDFTNANFDETKFAYNGDPKKIAKYVKPTKEGLRIALPADPNRRETFSGIHPRLQLSGDFIATMEYSDLKASPPKDGAVGLSFRAVIDRSSQSGINVRQLVVGTATNASWSVDVPNKGQMLYWESIAEYPAAARLRLQRHGSTIYYFLAEPGSNNFRLVSHRPVGTNNVKLVNIQSDCGDMGAGSEFVLKNLSIRATKITKSN